MKIEDQNFKIMMADRLKQVAAYLGLQEQVLAQRIGISKQTMNNYTTGRNEPKPSTLVTIANAFNIDPLWLLTGQGDMLGNPSKPEHPMIPLEELNDKLTPIQREMLTYKRLQTELEMPKEKISAGIDTIISGKYSRAKSKYSTAEPPADPGYNNVHEPGAGFGKKEKE